MEKPLEFNLHWTKHKLVIQRDVKTKTFIVDLPKHASVRIHHTMDNVDVMGPASGSHTKGKTVPIDESEIVRLTIAVVKAKP